MIAGVIATDLVPLRLARLGDLEMLAACLLMATALYLGTLLGTLLLIDRRILLEARGLLLKGF